MTEKRVLLLKLLAVRAVGVAEEWRVDDLLLGCCCDVKELVAKIVGEDDGLMVE